MRETAVEASRPLDCAHILRRTSYILVTSDISLPSMLPLVSQLLVRLLAGIGVSYAGSRRGEPFVSGKAGCGKIRFLPGNEELSV